MTAKTAEDRLRYAQQYAHVLTSSRILELLQFSPNKRIHIMKSLSCLARFTGRTEQWRHTRQQYSLTWSTGTEKIDAFTRFFDDGKSLDVMLQWLREAIQVLPSKYANLLLFCTLTGMRGSECVESIRLLSERHFTSNKYYNPERQMLQHYLYPQIFIKRTKAIYISIVDDEIIEIARKIGQNPTHNGLKRAIMRRCLSMKIKYCRKIYASYIHQKSGESPDMIDMLQGRIGKNIFLKHYLTPDTSFKARILASVHKLKQELIEN